MEFGKVLWVIMFSGAVGQLAGWVFRMAARSDKAKREAIASHSITIEAQDDGGYQVVE